MIITELYLELIGMQQLSTRKIDRAIDVIKGFDGGVVALSAGVDSSLVAVVARQALGDRAVAVTGVSPSLPLGELEIARRTAEEAKIRHITVETSEMHNDAYTSNPTNRCYYCKDTLYRELRRVADSLGLEAIFDGTHVDDLSDTRPGLRAAREAGVVSPLLIAGFTKLEVRDAAKSLGLSVWDKPAMPCLSSRIPHGSQVTGDRLIMIDQAEAFIKSLIPVRDLRVRWGKNNTARIEVDPEARNRLLNGELFDKIDSKLRRLGFSVVTLDLRGYTRTGSQTRSSVEIVLPMVHT